MLKKNEAIWSGMRSPHFIAYSCGASHLSSVHLRMNASGRCDLLDFQMVEVALSSSDALLWLKATSSHLATMARRYRGDHPSGFVIPGHIALAKYLRIPQAPAAKKHKIVAFEARQHIPYPIGEVTWGQALVQQDELDFEVLLGAARTEVVEAIARYSKESKISLDGIEPATTALVNGFRFNYPEVNGCSTIIAIGARSTEIVYVDRGRYYSRNVPFGGQSVTVRMAEALDLPVSDAERIKRSALEGEPVSAEEQAAFSSACRSFVDRLMTEATRTGAVLQRQGQAMTPSQAYVTGGGSLLPNLEYEIASGLGIPVERYDPVRKLHIADEEMKEQVVAASPYLADAIGMGLGRFMPDAVSVDLTPRSLLWQRRFRRQQPFYLVAGLVACGAVGLPIFNNWLEIRAYEQEIANLDVQIRPLSQLNQAIYDRTEQIKRIKDVIEKAGSTADLRVGWLGLLNELQGRLATVEDVWLDKLRLERGEEALPRGTGFARIRKPDTRTTLRLEGRLIDVRNPMTSVSPDSYRRVKELLESFRESSFVASLEDERFDYSVPGILKFDFTLVVEEGVRL